jgi:hypothetical protein
MNNMCEIVKHPAGRDDYDYDDERQPGIHTAAKSILFVSAFSLGDRLVQEYV